MRIGKTKEEKGRERYVSFLKKKLELPVSWAWNGITPEEKRTYRKALEEVREEEKSSLRQAMDALGMDVKF